MNQKIRDLIDLLIDVLLVGAVGILAVLR